MKHPQNTANARAAAAAAPKIGHEATRLNCGFSFDVMSVPAKKRRRGAQARQPAPVASEKRTRNKIAISFISHPRLHTKTRELLIDCLTAQIMNPSLGEMLKLRHADGSSPIAAHQSKKKARSVPGCSTITNCSARRASPIYNKQITIRRQISSCHERNLP